MALVIDTSIGVSLRPDAPGETFRRLAPLGPPDFAFCGIVQLPRPGGSRHAGALVR